MPPLERTPPLTNLPEKEPMAENPIIPFSAPLFWQCSSHATIATEYFIREQLGWSSTKDFVIPA